MGFRKIKSWYGQKPESWKKHFFYRLGVFGINVISLVVISYIIALVVATGCNLVSDRIAGTINRNLTQLAEPYEKPKLEGLLISLSAGEAVTPSVGTSTNPVVVVMVQVFNSGSPSVIRNWQLKAMGIGDQTVYGKTPYPEPAHIYSINNGETNSDYSLNDSLRLKTSESAIGHGESRQGFVTFIFPGINKDFLVASTTSYILTFQDVIGTNYTMSPINLPAPHP